MSDLFDEIFDEVVNGEWSETSGTGVIATQTTQGPQVDAVSAEERSAIDEQVAELVRIHEAMLLPCHRCGHALALQNTWTPSYWTECGNCGVTVQTSSIELSTEPHEYYNRNNVWPLAVTQAALAHAVNESNRRISRDEMNARLVVLIEAQLQIIRRLFDEKSTLAAQVAAVEASNG